MKNLIASFAIAVMTVISAANIANAADNISRQSRTVSLEHFDKMSVGQGICVNYTPYGADSYATVSAPDGVLDNIEVTVSGDMLKIDYAKDYAAVRHYGETVVSVTAPGLCKDYECHSAGTIDIKSAINAPDDDINVEASTDGLVTFRDVCCNKLDVECRSGSKVVCEEVRCADVVCDCTSTSTVELSGNCNTCRLEANAHSKIEASKLTALTGNVISGDRCTVEANVKSPDTINAHDGGTIANL